MPNTLIHIAIQAPISRAIFVKMPIPWILVGAIIPDIPWICQRIALSIGVTDPFQARLYFTVQSSLVFCIILSAALAFFGKRPLQLFSLLALNSIMHLLLDSLQIKWGNGVHLFAPFNWHLANFGLLWPEHVLGYTAAIFAIIYLVLQLKTMEKEGLNLRLPSPAKLGLAALFLSTYLCTPLALMGQLEASNYSNIQTLRQSEARTGRAIALDRVHFTAEEKKVTVFSGESFALTGDIPDQSGTISLQGEFTAPYTIKSNIFHVHNGYRDYASFLGLFLSLSIWGYLFFLQYSNTAKGAKK